MEWDGLSHVRLAHFGKRFGATIDIMLGQDTPSSVSTCLNVADSMVNGKLLEKKCLKFRLVALLDFISFLKFCGSYVDVYERSRQVE
jgi:hypothetical protein